MFDFTKCTCRGCTDALARAIAAFQFRETRFNFLIAPAQSIIIGIGDKRRILLVIGDIVGRYFFCKPRQFRFGFGLAKRIDRRLCRHYPTSSSRCAAARASSVIFAPDNIRATSSSRALSSNGTTLVLTEPFSPLLLTCQ